MQQNSSASSGKKGWKLFGRIFGGILLGLVLLFGGFLGFLTAAEYRPEPVEPAASGADKTCPVLSDTRLRVLSFNTGYGGLGEESDFVMDGGKGPGTGDKKTVEKNLSGISGILQDAEADVYMLQEVDERSARTYRIPQLDVYSAVLPEHSWYFAPNYVCPFVPYPLQKPIGQIRSGVATYSRYRVEEASRISLPVPFSWPLRTANLKRCILMTRLPLADTDRELVILNFHLEAYDSGEGKLAQTRQMLEILQQEYEKGNYVLAGGDFNQVFPEESTEVKPTSTWVPGRLDPLPAEMEGWRYVYDDSVPSCRLLNQPYDPDSPLTQYYGIDGFVVSPNLEVLRVETLDEHFQYSDHNPVVLDLRLK